jgi:hypothetical protein
MPRIFNSKCLIAGISILLAAACGKDQRERLFEMFFPNIDFEIPAGLSATLPRVFVLEELPTNIAFYLREHGTDTSVISAISPARARLFTLDNLDYSFVEEISVRICPTTVPECTLADEVFYIDDLFGRAGRDIRLLPSLRNAKQVLSRNQFKLEVVFFFRFTTPYSVNSRLEMSFEAVR